MKILWIADFSTKEHKGGAQQTNNIMIKEGRKRGHTIDISLGGSLIDFKSDYDLVVLNNITKYERAEIEALVASQKCVRYEHDYWVAREYPELYSKVKSNIFLSPLHLEGIEKIVGYKIENYHLVPSPVPSSIFKNSEGKREKGSILWVGNLCETKGSFELIDYIAENPEHKFYIVGFGVDIDKVKDYENVEYVGQLEMRDIVKYYQRCESFYHRPRYDEAFGRAVVEAYLCGCNLIANSNIGALSWDWDFSDYDLIKKNVQSQDKFWNILENEV